MRFRVQPPGAPVVPIIVEQHAAEAAVLWNVRATLIGAPHVRLLHLRRFDTRLAAHLDGLAVAGEYGSRLCERMLQNPGNSEVFVATVMALEGQRDAELQRPLAIAHAVPECLDGVVGAFMWTEPGRLQGIVARQLASEDFWQVLLAVSKADSALDSALADIWKPGKIAPPSNAPFAAMRSTVIAEPASTTIAGISGVRRTFAATAAARRSRPTRSGNSSRTASGRS